MPPKQFWLRPSPHYLIGLIILVFGGVVAVWAVPVPFAISFPITVFAFIYGAGLYYQVGLLRGKQALIGLGWQDSQWLLTFNKTETHACPIKANLRGAAITRFGVFLRFQSRDVSRPVKGPCLILPSSLPAGQFRELLLLLRMG